MIEQTNHAPALAIEDLHFRYGREGSSEGWSLAIDDLCLEAGEQMLLRGGSGRGKSTLLHLIAGLIDPQRGRIRLMGTDVHALHGADRDRFRGRTIGMIFQTFNLLHGFSAVENVMAAMMFSEIPRREHRQRASALLEHLGIIEPERDPLRMSVGQQQRIAVARAVACHPALVLADEPTASLDPENSDAAMSLIQQTCREQGAALLCVSHDPTMVERFQRVETLDALSESSPSGRGQVSVGDSPWRGEGKWK